ncbi:TetR family transcriptional regulator [Streptomyces sp. NPDC058470]|uniref:imine reductase family protein n=1 Tax=Streptomyces sp. NPDC058470 TaxID=3346515 RepID=UPI003654D135
MANGATAVDSDTAAVGREQARQRVIEAAADLLAREGRDAVTTRAVAVAAGMQAPAIYRLFGDKDGLLEAVAEHGFAAFLATKNVEARPQDPIEDLRAGWDLAVEFGLANPAPYTLFERHQQTLGVPVGTTYVGEDAGFAALHDVALLSAMYGMFAGSAHAFALIRKEDIDPAALAPLLADWLVAMAPAVHQTADQLRSGDYTKGVVSNLAMQVAGTPTFLSTAEQQGVSPELLSPYFELMRRRLTEGNGEEDLTGVIDLLVR